MICSNCGKEYNKSKDFRTKYRTYSKFCSQKCYDKYRQPEVREKIKDFTKQFGTTEKTVQSTILKLQLVDLCGGKCEICGYNKNLSALEFHHLDKKTKEFELDATTLLSKSDDELLSELLKCQLLCANCHREVHSPIKDMKSIRKVISSFVFNRRGKRKIN